MKPKKETKQQRQEKKTPNNSNKNIEPQKYLIALAVIVVISFIAYLPALQGGFVWDDDDYVKHNPLILSFNLKAIFSEYVVSNYHPITILTLAIEHSLFGMNETGYHAVNLMLHLFNVILVFYCIFLLSEKVLVGLVAALLFGVHPLHVESVAWVSELKDLLYTFFFLGSYFCYLKFLQKQQQKYFLLAIFLFLLSLLSKAMAASLPVVLILTDYFKNRTLNVKVWLEKAPFFILAIIFGIVAVMAQKSTGAIQDVTSLSFPQRLVFACYGFVTYIFKFILPLQLCSFYPYPIKMGESIPALYYVYVLIFLLIALTVFYSLHKSKKILFGVGFFSITVFLVLQLLPVGGAVMADRYSYIPSIGIGYLVGELLFYLWNKNQKLVPAIILGAFTIFFSAKTYSRCAVWKTELSLWTDVIEQYQTIPFAYYVRGTVYMNDKKNDKALLDFNKSLELDPKSYKAYHNRGALYMNGNKFEEALSDFNNSLTYNPKYIKAYYNRGTVYMNLKDYTKAIEDFNKTISMDPKFTEAYINRGNVYRDMGKYDEAFKDFNTALQQKPDLALVYFNIGNLYYLQKRNEEALSNLSKAISLNPNYAEAFYNRGLIKYSAGDKVSCCSDLKIAIGLKYQPAVDASVLYCK